MLKRGLARLRRLSSFAGKLQPLRDKRSTALVSCLALVLGTNVAVADSVNGLWCSGDGRQFEISFEEVTLDSGEVVFGDYDRHHFLFTMPSHSRLGDTTVELVMGMKDRAIVRYISQSGIELHHEMETWARCELQLSQR
ncbi:MAG: hypothetical protein OXQ92_10650 [Boseongicola sp.]|nr:hypothetical protein [Boseongicola sp.]MDD9978252.1 hypothetical protein [Boseongicola sp.]